MPRLQDRPSKAAVEVAAEIINGKHPELSNIPLAAEEGLPGLGGAKLELIFVDHQGNPSVAQQQALRLVSQDKVNVLFGAYQSSCSLTATAVGERYGIPFMVGDSAALNITGRGFKWVYRVTPIASDYAATYMRFFADMKKQGKTINSIAIVNENTDYGTSVADAIEARGEEGRHQYRAPRPLQRERHRRRPAGAAAQGEESGCGDLHQLHLRQHPLHEDDAQSRLPAADGDRRRLRLLRSVLHSGGGRYRAGRDEPQRLGHRQAGIDHLQDQRDVQGQDRPRSRRHQRAQHAGDAGARPRRINRAGSTDPEKIREALAKTDLKPDQLMMGYKGVKFDETGQNILAATYLIQLKDKALRAGLAGQCGRDQAGMADEGLEVTPHCLMPPAV